MTTTEEKLLEIQHTIDQYTYDGMGISEIKEMVYQKGLDLAHAVREEVLKEVSERVIGEDDLCNPDKEGYVIFIKRNELRSEQRTTLAEMKGGR